MTNKKIEKELSTKEKIQTTAFELFAKKGLKDVSMREIAEACGITKPVIYYYFKDKDDLCFEMVKNMLAFQESKLQEFAQNSSSFQKFLEELFSSYLNSVMNKSIVAFMLHLHSYIPSRPELTQKLKGLKDSKHDIIKKVIKKEIKEERLSPDMYDALVHLIMANSIHMVLNAGETQIKFKPAYPREMSKAILRAVEYKGETK